MNHWKHMGGIIREMREAEERQRAMCARCHLAREVPPIRFDPEVERQAEIDARLERFTLWAQPARGLVAPVVVASALLTIGCLLWWLL